MRNTYHILNGDSLRQQFPKELHGEILVTRECLIEGDVKGNGIEEFFETRAKFIGSCYGNSSETSYHRKVVTEFRKMQTIPGGADVSLWFEDDLFCQVNFWFVMNLLSTALNNCICCLVRPKKGSEYSFGGMNTSELMEAYRDRMTIEASEAHMISELWNHYQVNDCDAMIKTAEKLNARYPFLLPAIQAHIDRIPAAGKPGKVTQTLKDIINDLGTTEFAPIFKEFSKRAKIYGFGDMQVRHLLAEMESNQ